MRIQKYQSPSNGIIQQDNTRVAIKPIEQTFIKRTYQPKQAYLSQDNRTKLQHEQGQKKADEAYNELKGSGETLSDFIERHVYDAYKYKDNPDLRFQPEEF